MNKKLYTGYSYGGFISALIFKVALVLVIMFVIPHYDENPRVIVAVIIICILSILIAGTDQIIIYSDRIVQRTDSFMDLIFPSRGRTYLIKEIKAASLRPAPGVSEVGVGILLAFLLPRTRGTNNSSPVFLDMKDGRMLQITTDLGLSKKKEIVDIINSITK